MVYRSEDVDLRVKEYDIGAWRREIFAVVFNSGLLSYHSEIVILTVH
jgi:hypothetical protein